MPVPDRLEIRPLDKPLIATIRVPGSKSITNRALVLGALTGRGFAWAVRGALQSEDTELMVDALRALGFRVLTEWPDSLVSVYTDVEAPMIPAAGAELFVGNSGTTMRFLTAMVSLGHGRFRLDGVGRMRERPIADLLNALAQLGVRAVAERGNGRPPIVVEGRGLRGGRVHVRGDVSSQFLSGLMMATPFADSETVIEVDGHLVSWPYVYMTARMLWQFGLGIDHAGGSLEATLRGSYLTTGDRREWGLSLTESSEPLVFRIPGCQWTRLPDHLRHAEREVLAAGIDPRHPIRLREYLVEPDASAASYFLAAAALTDGEVSIPGLPLHGLQGDTRFAEVLADMGCELSADADRLTLKGGPLAGLEADMSDISDTVMTLAAVACFAEGSTTIRNVAHIRHKETDRLAALATELRKVGAGVEELKDGLTITPRPLHGAEIETYNDHRMAMSMALIGLRVPGIVIKNPGCVAKTYPEFFTDLEKLRA